MLARAARLRRRRSSRPSAVVGVVTLALGLVIGLAVPRAQPAGQTFAAFDCHVGPARRGDPGPVWPTWPTSCSSSDTRGFGLAFHGDATVLAATDDGGDTWRVVDATLPADLPAQLEFADAAHGYLWGGAPSAQGAVPLWVTADGGRSWGQAPVGPVVSDVSAIGPDVWAVVGTCPHQLPAGGRRLPGDGRGLGRRRRTWTPTAAAPPVSEEPGLSVADQDLELARITPARAYVLSFAPARPAG